MPCIQSAYACKVRTSASGSAWAEKVALGLQYALHPSQPLPVSQASKNCMATCLIDAMGPPVTLCFWFKLGTRSHATSHEQQAAAHASRSFAARGGVATHPQNNRRPAGQIGLITLSLPQSIRGRTPRREVWKLNTQLY